MAFGKKKKNPAPPVEEQKKPTPAYLRDDYPYKAIGEPITDMSQVKDGIVYEIKCHKCEMSIRSQGQNIRSTYERIKDKGCIGCGNKELVVKLVDMSKAPKNIGPKAEKAETAENADDKEADTKEADKKEEE